MHNNTKSNNSFNPPTFPEEVYNNLPIFLQDLVSLYKTPEERDAVLIACLTVLSGCLSSIIGRYRGDWVNASLMAYLMAPSASNKSKVIPAKLLGKAIDDRFLATHQSIEENHNVKYRLWQQASRRDASLPQPEFPKYPSLFMPGNISAAAVYEHLDASDGKALMFETEASTIFNTFKQEWGSFKDVLLKFFQHESLSIKRLRQREKRIPRPQVAMLMTSTVETLPGLIQSSADGLLSRIIFYFLRNQSAWTPSKPEPNEVDLNEIFTKAGLEVLSMHDILNSKNCVFNLTDEQYDRFDSYFSEKLVMVEGEGDRGATVKRFGLICFRFAMILTALRKTLSSGHQEVFTCDDEDFQTALLMVDTLFAHSMHMYNLLPKKAVELNTGNATFLNSFAIGQKFSGKEAEAVGLIHGMKDRTVRNYILQLRSKGMIEEIGHSQYVRLF